MKKFIIMLACVLLVAIQCSYGAAYTNYPASVGTGGGLPAIYAGRTYVLESSWTTDLGSGDTVKMIYIPANTFVQGVGLQIDTVSSGSGSAVSIGDSSASTNWLNATSVTNSANGMCAWSVPVITKAILSTGDLTTVSAPYSALGKVYTSADYILVTVGTAVPTNLDFTVKALAIPLDK